MLLICTCIVQVATAQNLVPNGDFEITGTVPCDWSLSPADFNNATSHWNSPTESTPDIHSTLISSNCTNHHPNSTASCTNGSQMPHSGNFFAGFYTYINTSNYREYLQVKLSSPMIPGAKYYVELYVSLGESSQYATNIGVGFSTSPTNTPTIYELGYSPQILFSNPVTDTDNWVLLRDSIEPTQPYEYIIIGNFFNNIGTNTVFVNPITCWDPTYYYCDDVSIYMANCDINLGNDTTLCDGETLTLDATEPNATYLWQDNSTNSTFNVSQPGRYWVQMTNSCGSYSDTIDISYKPAPTVNLGSDTTLCHGETVTLNAANTNATYLWQDNSTNPTFNVSQPGTYWVEVTVDNCTETDRKNIKIGDCEIILDIPNLITPNNDGFNDLFVPVISKGIVSMNTIVYNRWGDMIFRTDNLLMEWDAHDVSDGVYYWIVYYIDINGKANSLKGHLSIVR